MRLPFNLIVTRAFQLIDMIVISDSFELQMALREELDLFLSRSGWTELDFDASLLDFINDNWSSNIN